MFFHDTATTEFYTLSLHNALPISATEADKRYAAAAAKLSAARSKAAEKLNKAVNAELAPLKLERAKFMTQRSEEHTSELQSRRDLVCRLLLEKKKSKTGVW